MNISFMLHINTQARSIIQSPDPASHIAIVLNQSKIDETVPTEDMLKKGWKFEKI